MTNYTQLEKNRLDKLADLKAEGVEPYPHQVTRTHTSRAAIQAFETLENAGEATDGETLPATLVGRLR